jgi:diguanylate cyclase (GGDEF)-like protein
MLRAANLRIGGSLPGWSDQGVRTILLVGLPGVIALFLLTALNVGGLATWWEIGHWTLTAAMAVGLAVVGVGATSGTERRVRALGATAVGVYLAGQLLWDGQVALGMYPVPAPSDVLFLGMAVPFVGALALAVRAYGSQGELRTFVLDAAVLVAAVVAVIFFVFATVAAGAVAGLGIVLLLYPIIYLGLAGAVLVAALLARSRVAPRGPYLAAFGITVLGGNWVWYIASVIDGQPTTGSVINMLGSIAAILIGLGVASWQIAPSSSERLERVATQLLTFLPVGAIGIAAAILVWSEAGLAGISLVDAAAALVIVVAIVRQTLLLGDQTAFSERERRTSERERELREGVQQALAARETSETRYRTLVDVFNRLGEQTTFAADEGSMFTAAAAALAQLVPAPAGDILAINPSADRLCVALAWGDGAPTPGSAVEIDGPDRCFGIRRGTTFGVDDATDPWTPTCPAHATDRGSTICVPMVAAGKLIGVIHLARLEPRSFDEDDRRQASRIAEQVALAVSNARLIRTMEGLALTDGLTGLHNGRFFDPFVDRELAHAERDGTPVGVIAIDLDHFKQFNDTNGHPAGDEALRTFARGCLGVLRKSDTMARLGGEEFCIAVRGADLAATMEIAEKLRATVEHLAVEIGPGRFARMTASFGVANSQQHGTDRMRLLKTADRALYAAKRLGRNAVVAADSRSKPARASTPASVASSRAAQG